MLNGSISDGISSVILSGVKLLMLEAARCVIYGWDSWFEIVIFVRFDSQQLFKDTYKVPILAYFSCSFWSNSAKVLAVNLRCIVTGLNMHN